MLSFFLNHNDDDKSKKIRTDCWMRSNRTGGHIPICNEIHMLSFPDPFLFLIYTAKSMTDNVNDTTLYVAFRIKRSSSPGNHRIRLKHFLTPLV